MKNLYSGTLPIEYGQFYFDDPYTDPDALEEDYLEPDLSFENQENGLCGASQGGKLFFVTGIQDGMIFVDCEFHESAPDVHDGYDEIVEVSIENPNDQLSLCSWGHENIHKLGLDKGGYRVRYLIKGMDKEYDDEEGDEDCMELPVEGQKYLIQIWAANFEKDAIVKHTSENAGYWHQQLGSMK